MQGRRAVEFDAFGPFLLLTLSRCLSGEPKVLCRYHLISSSKGSRDVGILVMPVLQMEKLRPRPSHWDLNTRGLAAEPSWLLFWGRPHRHVCDGQALLAPAELWGWGWRSSAAVSHSVAYVAAPGRGRRSHVSSSVGKNAGTGVNNKAPRERGGAWCAECRGDCL